MIIEQEEKNWGLFISASILLIVAIVTAIIGYKYENEFENAKKAIEQYSAQNYIEDDIERVIAELKDSAHILIKALKLFIGNVVFNALVAVLLIVPKMIYKDSLDSFWESIHPDNLFNCICCVFIIVLTVLDIYAPLSEFSQYLKLLKEIRNALYSIDTSILSIAF